MKSSVSSLGKNMLQSVILAGITGRTITTVGTVIEIGIVIAIEVVATAVSICGCPFFQRMILELVGM